MPTAPIRAYRHDVGQRPLVVIWEITQACPLACLHCRAQARPHRDPGELTGAQARDLMAQVAEFGSPSPLFVLTGGDPFQRPDLFDLVRYGAEVGLPMAVSPSGTPTLTAGRLAELRDAGDLTEPGRLDGAGPRPLSRGARSLRATTRAWQAARDLGLKVQVNTSVTGHNLDDLADIARVLAVHPAGEAVQRGGHLSRQVRPGRVQHRPRRRRDPAGPVRLSGAVLA